MSLAADIGLSLVQIPAGEFMMGSSRSEIEDAMAYWGTHLLEPQFTLDQFRSWLMKEYPAHPVRVAAFSMSTYPVTNAQYRRFVAEAGAEPCESLSVSGAEHHPVWGVTHRAATDFCTWLDGGGGGPFRLPHESEWEYAARGPSHRDYPFGNGFDPARCNTAEAGIQGTTPVDRYEEYASEWGVVDLAGNVEEWTSDQYLPYPNGGVVDDDLSSLNGDSYRVLRGGSFARGGDLARCARRHGPHPGREYRYRGFRVVTRPA